MNILETYKISYSTPHPHPTVIIKVKQNTRTQLRPYSNYFQDVSRLTKYSLVNK